jgi:proline iminopeptidase
MSFDASGTLTGGAKTAGGAGTNPRSASTALLLLALIGFPAARSAAADPEPAGGAVTDSIPRDGFDLHYRIVGRSGPYLVILSGGPGLDVDYMESVTGVLAATHRCVLLEQRGTGRSRLPVLDETTINWAGYLGDLEALRQHLGVERLTLLGHSWGMTYALAYAAAHPDRARGVVTLGSAPITADFMQVFGDNRRSRLHPAEAESLASWSDPRRWELDPDRALLEYLRAITPTDFFDRTKGLAHAEQWELAWCHGRVGEVAEKTIWSGMDMRPELRAITCPVLLVHGYQDVAGEANMLAAKACLRDVKLEFVHRCGHYPWIDQPEETWRIVLPFLAGLPH